ncbi:mycofactocin system glycosyltransferase [Jatrophihabitans sp. GAS493]|uniref:mycofactocin biosynthesis glycosyltransferase MftF n=1 Tax=Jatrophihabitans sp. GAS493 TaxID=1907575 RepID=UPI000BB944A5|nr:mycofactocin biosynthesis glycosyltransferase MftF [Jatrophihabitans sp. GAS493]SOD72178.1 mycofactocin system glycosyltransferase [Jatrophihabitans sp. GAS493]
MTAKADAAVGLPIGFGVEIDADTKQVDEVTLFGGSPARLMRLSAAGGVAWRELTAGPIVTSAAAVLSRSLSDAGVIHPVPPPMATRPDITAVIPVRDRVTMLGRCLDAIEPGLRVVVVDDGSRDPSAIAAVCRRRGVELIRRPQSGGAGAARNSGLVGLDTDFVAFLDSDCIPTPGWLTALAAHLVDPMVGAVAPRIVATPTTAARSAVARYTAVAGSLDLGERPARVQPGTRVAYVPTAALLVRTTALQDVLTDGQVFDPALRYGEDVDLIWRLHKAGWRIRYDPTVLVEHHEPQTWTQLLSRRYRYGTSAGPLAVRHPSAMVPLVLQPWPALAVGAALTGRRRTALLGAAGAVVSLAINLKKAGLPPASAVQPTGIAVQQTWLGIGRYLTQFAAPTLLASLVAPSRGGRARWRRLALVSLLVGGPLTRWWTTRPEVDPFRFVAASIADDVCYGAGVYAGCRDAHTLIPLRPRISWRPYRFPARSKRGSD